jgi:hypothetical protein
MSTVFWTPNIIVLLNKKTAIFALLKKLSIDGPNGSKYVTVIFPRFCSIVLSPQSTDSAIGLDFSGSLDGRSNPFISNCPRKNKMSSSLTFDV